MYQCTNVIIYKCNSIICVYSRSYHMAGAKNNDPNNYNDSIIANNIDNGNITNNSN